MMKISQHFENAAPANHPVQPAAGKAGSGTTPATAPPTVPAGGVALTVSTMARSLGAASRDQAAVDMSKVNAMRAAIAQGSFVVNPEAIADQLLVNAQEMLKSSRH